MKSFSNRVQGLIVPPPVRSRNRHGASEGIGDRADQLGFLDGHAAIGGNTGSAGGENLLFEIARGGVELAEGEVERLEIEVVLWQGRSDVGPSQRLDARSIGVGHFGRVAVSYRGERGEDLLD